MKGVGRTCGEEIEVSWAHTNPLATSVREMGPAAQHETLNDHWNGWNFHKIVGFHKRLYYLLYRTSTDPLAGKSFLRKLREAAKMQVRISLNSFPQRFRQPLLRNGQPWWNIGNMTTQPKILMRSQSPVRYNCCNP